MASSYPAPRELSAVCSWAGSAGPGAQDWPAGCDNQPPMTGWLSQPADRNRCSCAAGGSGG